MEGGKLRMRDGGRARRGKGEGGIGERKRDTWAERGCY